jgi:hypothetical protein
MAISHVGFVLSTLQTRLSRCRAMRTALKVRMGVFRVQQCQRLQEMEVWRKRQHILVEVWSDLHRSYI